MFDHQESKLNGRKQYSDEVAELDWMTQCATGQGIILTCKAGFQCASYGNTLYGCCPEGRTSCPMPTTCVEQLSTEIWNTGPYGVYCTDPSKRYCATFTVDEIWTWRTCEGTRFNAAVTEVKAIIASAPARLPIGDADASVTDTNLVLPESVIGWPTASTDTSQLSDQALLPHLSILDSSTPLSVSTAIAITTQSIRKPSEAAATNRAAQTLISLSVDSQPSLSPAGGAGIAAAIIILLIAALFGSSLWFHIKYKKTIMETPRSGIQHLDQAQLAEQNIVLASYARDTSVPWNQDGQQFLQAHEPPQYHSPLQFEAVTRGEQDRHSTWGQQSIHTQHQQWHSSAPPSYNSSGPPSYNPLTEPSRNFHGR